MYDFLKSELNKTDDLIASIASPPPQSAAATFGNFVDKAIEEMSPRKAANVELQIMQVLCGSQCHDSGSMFSGNVFPGYYPQ